MLMLLEWASPSLNAAHFRSHQVITRHHFDNDYQEIGQLRGKTFCRLPLSIQVSFCGQVPTLRHHCLLFKVEQCPKSNAVCLTDGHTGNLSFRKAR